MLYTDVEIVNLLGKTNYFKSKYDAHYCLRDFEKCLTERVNVTDELIHAFDELFFVLNKNPERPKSREILVDKGLIKKPLVADACQSRHDGCTYSNDSDEANDYEDVVEDSNLVDLEVTFIRQSANSWPYRIYLDSSLRNTFFKIVVV